MESKATARYIRISPQKARLVVDLVRGKKLEEAINILSFTPKKASPIVIKLLKSAMANASSIKTMDLDKLYVNTIFVNPGPALKRMRPMPMGRSGKILKKMSHITVILKEKK